MRPPGKAGRVGVLAGSLSMFSRVKGNALAAILVEPLWSIPFSLFSVYATIYMRALGLTPPQVGVVLALGHLSNTALAVVSGGIADRLGRKKTTLVFDLLGWSIPTLLWATARSYSSFVTAALMNGFASVVGSAWTCLLVEDTPPEDRTAVFTAVQVSWVVGGFFCPLAGMLVGRLGIVTGTRALYWLAFGMMTAMFLLRNGLIRETSVGRQRMMATRQGSLSVPDLVRQFGAAARLVSLNRLAMVMLGLSTLLTLRDALNTSMSHIYLVEVMRMKPSTIALFPLIGSAVQLVALFALVPAIRPLGDRASISAGLWALVVAAVLFVAAAPGGTAVALVGLSTLAGAAGLALAGPAVNASWNNAVPDQERASLLSVLAVLAYLARAAGSLTAGFLYSASPVLPFLVILGLACMMLILSAAAGRAREAVPRRRLLGAPATGGRRPQA